MTEQSLSRIAHPSLKSDFEAFPLGITYKFDQHIAHFSIIKIKKLLFLKKLKYWVSKKVI